MKLGEWRMVVQNVYRCVLGEGVEKLVIKYVRTEWMAQTNVVEYFLCTGSAKYTRTSPPAKKILLFFFFIIAIISSYAIIRI